MPLTRKNGIHSILDPIQVLCGKCDEFLLHRIYLFILAGITCCNKLTNTSNEKILFLIVLFIGNLAMSAATYRVKYDVLAQKPTNFTVVVGYERLTINNNAYALCRMNPITSYGLTFDSYLYGEDWNGMLAISQKPIEFQNDSWTIVSGYVILFDNKAFLANKIN